jgi:hypothetical protein
MVILGICEAELRAFKAQFEDKGFYSAIQSCRHRISRKRGSDSIAVRFQGNGAGT